MITALPFWGEFGHELMKWQGHLRYLSKTDDIQVYCMLGHSFLYEDFASEVHDTSVTRATSANMWMPVCNADMSHLDNPTIAPSKKICCNPDLPQEFFQYGSKRYGGNFDYEVVVHARKCSRKGDKITGDRSYKHWDELVERLDVDACVGSPDESDYIDGVEDDLRGIPLKTLADVLANTKLLITPSSGVAHFASLCGCPHLVWTDKRKWNVGGIKTTNWNRYKKHWNPFGTECVVIDDEPDPWQPSVDRILRAIEKSELL